MGEGMREGRVLPVLHRDEVDGVPVFWVETGRPTLAASLLFRTGIVDETLPTTGWTHLAEHLALHGRDGNALSVNGSTALSRTELQAHGDAQHVAAFLTSVSGWLGSPDLSRIHTESRVLRAEAEYRGAGDAAAAVLQRYGARGPGLAGYTEPGLSRAAPEALAAFVAERFTRGNAALVLDGPPPASLRLGLRPGPVRPVPEPPATDDPRPAAYGVGEGRLVMSGEVPRTPAATFLPAVLQDMLRRDLREGAGGAYSPWCSYEAVGPDTAVVLAGSDVARSILPTIAHYVLSGLAALRERGPIAGVVEEAVALAVQSLRDPFRTVQIAYRAAIEHLDGKIPTEAAALLEEVSSVTPEQVHALVDGFADSLLLGMPADAHWESQLPLLQMPAGALEVQGESHRSRNTPADRTRLVVGPTGVAVGSGATWRQIAQADIAGVLAFPDGARHVVDVDGWGLTVEPTVWKGGSQAVAALDRTVPESLRIPMEERDPATVPRPEPALVRWRQGTAPYRQSLLLVVLAPVLLVALAVVGLGPVGLGAAGAALYRAVRAWPRRSRDRDASGVGS